MLTQTRHLHFAVGCGEARNSREELVAMAMVDAMHNEQIRIGRNAVAFASGRPTTKRPTLQPPPVVPLIPRRPRGKSAAACQRRIVMAITMSAGWEWLADAPVAAHEAAHAVVALDRAVLPLRTSLTANGGVVTHCRDLYPAADVAIMSLSGAIAQSRVLTTTHGRPVVCHPSREDEEGVKAAGAERERLQRIAEQRVDLLWFAISAVARELICARSLSSGEIIRICRPSAALFRDKSRF